MYLFFFYKNIFYEIIEAAILLKRTQLILCLKICKLSTIHVFNLTEWKRLYHWQQILPNFVLGCFDLTMCLV